MALKTGFSNEHKPGQLVLIMWVLEGWKLPLPRSLNITSSFTIPGIACPLLARGSIFSEIRLYTSRIP